MGRHDARIAGLVVENGDPKSSDEAIERARRVLLWTEEAGIDARDLCVRGEFLGGGGVLVSRDCDSRAWIACHNNGHDNP